jgi:hypothetical protein
LAQQHGKAIEGRRLLGLELRQQCLGGFQARAAALYIQFGAAARLETQRGQMHRFLLIREIIVGDFDLLLGAAQ